LELAMSQSKMGLLGVLLGCAVGIAGCASASPLAEEFGNTLHYEAVDGSLELWFRAQADGSYTGLSRAKPKGAPVVETPLSGRWTVAGGQSCRHQTSPAPPREGLAYCEPLTRYPLGRTVLNHDGKFRVTLERGDTMPAAAALQNR
jgi:hypothetical protein